MKLNVKLFSFMNIILFLGAISYLFVSKVTFLEM